MFNKEKSVMQCVWKNTFRCVLAIYLINISDIKLPDRLGQSLPFLKYKTDLDKINKRKQDLIKLVLLQTTR